MLSDVFISAMQRESIKESDPYDWEKETSDEDSVNALKTTLALAGITGMTTRADLVNQSQKNALGATLAAQSLMTPYGDNNNLLQGSNTNNNNQLKDHMSSNIQNQTNELNNNHNNNLDSSFNYNDVNMNGDKSNNNNPQSAKKIPKSLDRNARSKRNIASIIPPASSIDRESQSQSQQQQQRKSRVLELEQKSSAKQGESNNKAQNDNSTSAKNLISAQKPSTKTQASSNQAYAPTPSAVAAAAAVVQNAASLAAGATSSNAPYQAGSSGNQQQQQRLSMMQKSSQNKQPSNSRKEDSQASLSVGSESKNSNLAKLNSLNNNAIAHQPIIMNAKQTPGAANNTSPIGGNSGLSMQSNTPTTAGVALATAYNNTMNNNNNNNNNNNKSSSILGSSQASYSYSNSYARPNAKLNNSVDFTTPIGVTSSTVYQSPQYDMDLYQQNDSGIAMSATPNPASLNSALSALGNLKPPKTPVRMYSRDRSNHSSSVVYPIKNNESTPSLAGLSHGHLSRRSISNNNNNSHNLSILDSDAQSLPQGTFAIKAGPQTIMSQWVVTLDDGDEDEDDDDGEDPEEVDVVDDVVNYNRLG